MEFGLIFTRVFTNLEVMEEKPIQNRRLKLIVSIVVLVLAGIVSVWTGIQQQKSPLSLGVQTRNIYPAESSVSAQFLTDATPALVTRVVDGDTIVIENDRKVRLIGIDTPETVDPRRAVGCFGKEASKETKKLVEGKTVYLNKDVSEVDKYGRLLRYVYLPENDDVYILVNDYLVRAGFAKASTYPPDVRFAEQFRQAEAEARTSSRGLWQKCTN